MVYFDGALQDLTQGLKNWRFWGYLGWQDIRQRYRRSALGPFWVTISMAVFILALGFIYSKLFHVDTNIYIPYLASGYIVWLLFATIVNEGCNTFIEAEGYLRDVRLPLSIFVGRVVYRNLIIFLHNSVVYVGVIWYFHIPITLNMLFVIPGMALIIINAGWIVLLLGMLTARYRDIAPVIQSLVQVFFFITPIVWMPHSIPVKEQYIINYNPVNYFLDLVRQPISGHAPTIHTYYVSCIFAVVGWLIAFALFKLRYRRLVFWL